MPTSSDVADFEAAFLERAAEAVAGRSFDAVVCDRQARPGQLALGGWWCRPDTPGIVALPNPWDERERLAEYDQRAWALTREVVGRLASYLDELHGTRHGERYWDLLLAPLVQITVAQVLDRRLFARAAHALAPSVPALAPSAPSIAATTLEAVNRHDSDHFNGWLVGVLLGEMGHPVQTVTVPAADETGAAARGLLRRLRDNAIHIPAMAVRSALSGWRGRRIALLGQVNFAPRQLVLLAGRVRGLRVAPSPLRTGAWPVPAAGPGRSAIAGLAGGDPLHSEIFTVLAQVLPRCLIEGYGALVDESLRRFGPPAHAVHGNYGFDDVENEFLGRCEAAGRRLAFAQHGGMTLQLALSPGERHEERPGALRISWGGRGDNVRAVPNPHVDRLRDRHRGGDRVVIVEGVMPPPSYLLRFTTTPVGDQVFGPERLLEQFVEATGASRARLMLKRFPHSEDVPRAPAVQALPGPPRRGHGATYWMARARVAVLMYPDTPFLEAMVLGVPSIGLWDPGLWEMRNDAAGHFARLAEVGVIHADPEAAARHLDAIHDDPAAWWGAPEVRAARDAFLERFAIGGDWLGEWSRLLRELAS